MSKTEVKRLIFGDPKSIEERDKRIVGITIERLLSEIVCPICGAKPIECYDYSLEENRFNFNFACKPSCPNSYEYAEEHGFDEARTGCNSKGKFYE